MLFHMRFLYSALFLLILSASTVHGAEGECLDCHRANNEGIVKVWAESSHGNEGIDCQLCHGSDHEKLDKAEVFVDTKVCGQCHEDALDQHEKSRHVMGLHSGWGCTRNQPDRDQTDCSFCHIKGSSIPLSTVQCARFLEQTPEVGELGCNRCHQVERSCASCHTNHSTELAIVQEPDVCATCHMGPDHPQWEAWRTSKHGTLYSQGLGPSCQDCHFVQGHDVSAGIAYPSSGIVYPDEVVQKKRETMLEACQKCHSRTFAEDELVKADAIRAQSKAIVKEASEIIQDLYDRKLLDPMPEERPGHPLRGNQLVLDQQILYEDTSHIERLFFKMKKYDLAKTIVGVYHQNPDYMHWYGNAELKMGLTDIRAEAKRLKMFSKMTTKEQGAKPAEIEEELMVLKKRLERSELDKDAYERQKSELLRRYTEQ